MRALVRLVIVGVLLSGVAGSCLVIYFLGYSEGLRVQSKEVDVPHLTSGGLPPPVEPKELNMSVPVQP